MSINPIYGNFVSLIQSNKLKDAKKYLIDHNIDVNRRSTFYDSITVARATQSNKKVIKYLLEEKFGNVLAFLDTLELEPFIIGIEKLIKKGLNAHILYHNSFIHACGQNAIEIAEYTFDKTESTYSRNDLALIFACRNNQLNTVRYLLDKGVELKPHHLIKASKKECYSYLLKRFPKEKEHYEVLEYLLTHYKFDKIDFGIDIIENLFQYKKSPMQQDELYQRIENIIYLLTIKHNMPYHENVDFILRYELQLKNIIEKKKMSNLA